MSRVAGILLLVIGIFVITPVNAFAEAHKLDTECQYAVHLRFLDFWAKNGGVDTFGCPLESGSLAYRPGVVLEQYTTGFRLELHEDGVVRLGLLGEYSLSRLQAQITQNPSRFWYVRQYRDDCLELNGFHLCGEVLQAFRSEGLSLGDPGVSLRESIMLNGLPVGELVYDAVREEWLQPFQRRTLVIHAVRSEQAENDKDHLEMPEMGKVEWLQEGAITWRELQNDRQLWRSE